jgi:plastocyanin
LVRRQLTRAGTLAAAVVALLAAVPAADAANRRVTISNYQWSDMELELDRGEHVTWYWIGPDTMHTVTGDSPNARGIDSDPGIELPQHRIGDEFQVSFDQPGTYDFVCRLHSTVRGRVVVSSNPGDPLTEIDPAPLINVDERPPRVSDLALAPNPMHGRGGKLNFALDEWAKLDADYFRLKRNGKREFAGWAKWKPGHIGFNEIRFGNRGKRFDAEPGRYVAELRATDRELNTSEPRRIRFRITPKG